MQIPLRTDRQCRVARILKRATAELIQALDRGEVGVKTAERIAKLPQERQRIEVSRRQEARKLNAERQLAWRDDPKSRGRYASAGYQETRERRLRRIGRSAIPELTEAWQAGTLSLRGYDMLSRPSAARQRKALEMRERREAASALAARVIDSVLTRNPDRIDLGLVASKIIESIRRQA